MSYDEKMTYDDSCDVPQRFADEFGQASSGATRPESLCCAESSFFV
jgi:hypothetical protein